MRESTQKQTTVEITERCAQVKRENSRNCRNERNCIDLLLDKTNAIKMPQNKTQTSKQSAEKVMSGNSQFSPKDRCHNEFIRSHQFVLTNQTFTVSLHLISQTTGQTLINQNSILHEEANVTLSRRFTGDLHIQKPYREPKLDRQPSAFWQVHLPQSH